MEKYATCLDNTEWQLIIDALNAFRNDSNTEKITALEVKVGFQTVGLPFRIEYKDGTTKNVVWNEATYTVRHCRTDWADIKCIEWIN